MTVHKAGDDERQGTHSQRERGDRQPVSHQIMLKYDGAFTMNIRLLLST